MDQDQKKQQNLEVDINLDTTPILYTDNILMSANRYGITLDIGQKLGPTNKLRIVTRIAMSREHAKQFINELGKLIAMTDGTSQTGTKQN